MENQKLESTQVIIHKSDWANQFIKIGIFIFLLFALIKTNPSKQDLIKEVITVKLNSGENKFGKSIANSIGQFSYNTIGGLIEPFVIRKNFIIFSTYEIQFKYKDISINTSAVGILNYFFFDEKEKSELTSSKNVTSDNINKTESLKTETIEKSNVVINSETKKAEKKVVTKKIIIDAGDLEWVDVAFGCYWNGNWFSNGWYSAYTNKPITFTLPIGYNLNNIYWYAKYPGGVWASTNEKYFCIKNHDAFDFKNQNNCNNKVGFTKLKLNNEITYLRFYRPSTIVDYSTPSTIVPYNKPSTILSNNTPSNNNDSNISSKENKILKVSKPQNIEKQLCDCGKRYHKIHCDWCSKELKIGDDFFILKEAFIDRYKKTVTYYGRISRENTSKCYDNGLYYDHGHFCNYQHAYEYGKSKGYQFEN